MLGTEVQQPGENVLPLLGSQWKGSFHALPSSHFLRLEQEYMT